jgi:hypothetical protein
MRSQHFHGWGGSDGVADAGDAFFEGGGVVEDFDFDAEEVDWDEGFFEGWEADAVFFCGDDAVGEVVIGAEDAFVDFVFRVEVVVGVAAGDDDFAAEVAEDFFEAFGGGDAADGTGFAAIEEEEGLGVIRVVDILEDDWAVAAGDDFCGAVTGDDVIVAVLAFAFGEEDVAGAAEIARGFAESAAWEEVVIAEGGVAVDEDDVETAAEAEVLETVVEEERVAVEFADGPAAGFDAVFVDDDGDAGEIAGEHPWFVAGVSGVAGDVRAIADDERWRFAGGAEEASGETVAEGRFDAFVAAAEDSDLAAFLLEAAGEHFDDWGFAGAADGEVADADDGGSEVVIGFDAVSEERDAALDEAFEEMGEAGEEEAERACAEAAAVAEDDFDAPLFEAVHVFARHGEGVGQEMTRAPSLSAVTMRVMAGAGPCHERSMASATAGAESDRASEQTVEPEPLRKPPMAPALTPASMISKRPGTRWDR